MSARERRWNELQNRWAQGGSLSVEEETERRAYADHDSAARRELELFAALRERGAKSPEPVSSTLIARVLDEANGIPRGPRLRLVSSNGSEAAPSPLAPRPRVGRLVASALSLTALAAVAAVAVFVASGKRSPIEAPPSVPLATTQARAELVLAAGQVVVGTSPAHLGQRLLAIGERVSTAEGRACLTIDPGVDVCLAENSQIELDSLASNRVRVRVTSGTALASLSRREAGSTFALIAGDVSATAHGTTFAVRRSADETEVTVVEGTVEVEQRIGARELLDAHSRVLVPAGTAKFARTAIGRSEEARLLALRAAHSLWSGAAVGVLELTKTPQVAQASVDDEGVFPLPLQAFVGPGMHRVAWRDATGTETIAWIELTAGEARRLSPPEPPRPLTGEPSNKPSAASLLDRARRELTRGQPREALSLYEQLRAAHPASAEARTVLVTMGKLEIDLGQAKRALGHFEAYLRGGGGSLNPEALAGRARALRALSRSQEEVRAIQQYLATYPNGFDAPLFAKRLRELKQP